MKRVFLWALLTLLPLFFAVAATFAGQAPSDDSDVMVVGPVEPIFINRTLLDLPAVAHRLQRASVTDTNPRLITNPDALLRRPADFTPQQDPLLQRQLRSGWRNSRTFTVPDLNVAGQVPECCPPDTVGEVGPTHFIQMVNPIGGVGAGAAVQIYSKTTGASVGAPFGLSSLAPMGDICSGGDGDPIPLFDQLANRWLLTEFQADEPPNDIPALCVYVSSGVDPTTSTWTLYRFENPALVTPDYPKYAVWPDAYYVATNEDDNPIYALDRRRMLAGADATMIRRTVSGLDGFTFQIVPPVDIAGQVLPPTGAPGIFIRHRDDEAHDDAFTPASDTLEIFEFWPDFTNPDNSILDGPMSISIADFESDLCGLVSLACFEQPNGVLLDPLREPVMQRPVYRNFGTHQSLVGNFVTDIAGGMADRGGIRWFELRRPAGTTTGGWTLFQEGTVGATDGLNRWMGSLAIDKLGNMALGYSTVGRNTGQFPGIRYTGREVGDAPGTMPQPETTIIAGMGSQDFTTRWGDYSAMTVDPADDCTFWFTSEYADDGRGFPLTRIASFNYDACVNSCTEADGENLALSDDMVTINQMFEVCNTITVAPNYAVTATGAVTFQAGRSVVLLSGFSVESGGELVVAIQ